MGKRIIPQRRGSGSSKYLSPSHRHHGEILLPKIKDGDGYVKDIFHASGHTAPLGDVIINGKSHLMIAHLGMYIGKKIKIGNNFPVRTGNVLPIGIIPEGTEIYNIEQSPGDGGKFARAAGSSCTIVSQGKKTTIRMPSGSLKNLEARCRAIVGIAAGSGRTEKPFMKAGTKIKAYQSKAKRAYSVRGVAMNSVNHPHGGGNTQHIGKPSSVSKHAPPGRKVGRLAASKKNKR